MFTFIAGNHVCVPHLTFSWRQHKVNFTRRASLRLLFPILAPKPGPTTVMSLVSTPVCEWLLVYTPISPSLMTLQPSGLHLYPSCRITHRIDSADVAFLPTPTALQQWYGYGHQVRVPPLAPPIRTTDRSCKSRQHLRPLSNSRPMLLLPQSPAMGHLLISLPPATRPESRASRQHKELVQPRLDPSPHR